MYGHAPFHSALQLGHKYRELPPKRLQPLHSGPPRCASVCSWFCILKEMTCCGVEMYVWKCRQTKHVPDELTFLLSKHQFRLAVWNEPRHAPSLPSPERPVDRRHHLADCSLSLSLCRFLPLTSWQPALATSARTLPFWAPVCTDILQQQQMTRWDSGKIYSSFFYMEHCQERAKLKRKKFPFIQTLLSSFAYYYLQYFPERLGKKINEHLRLL